MKLCQYRNITTESDSSLKAQSLAPHGSIVWNTVWNEPLPADWMRDKEPGPAIPKCLAVASNTLSGTNGLNLAEEIDSGAI